MEDGKYYFEIEVDDPRSLIQLSHAEEGRVIGPFIAGDIITFAFHLPRRRAKGFRRHTRLLKAVVRRKSSPHRA